MNSEYFRYYTSEELTFYVGMTVQYQDLFGKVRTSKLEGSGSKVWLSDATCQPYAHTVKLHLP